jgi:hypothetical protein
MVHALAPHYPFTNGEGFILYHPSPREDYFAVAPGIEVSFEPYESTSTNEERRDSTLYNQRGKMIRCKEKGRFIDSVL